MRFKEDVFTRKDDIYNALRNPALYEEEIYRLEESKLYRTLVNLWPDNRMHIAKLIKWIESKQASDGNTDEKWWHICRAADVPQWAYGTVVLSGNAGVAGDPDLFYEVEAEGEANIVSIWLVRLDGDFYLIGEYLPDSPREQDDYHIAPLGDADLMDAKLALRKWDRVGEKMLAKRRITNIHKPSDFYTHDEDEVIIEFVFVSGLYADEDDVTERSRSREDDENWPY